MEMVTGLFLLLSDEDMMVMKVMVKGLRVVGGGGVVVWWCGGGWVLNVGLLGKLLVLVGKWRGQFFDSMGCKHFFFLAPAVIYETETEN